MPKNKLDSLKVMVTTFDVATDEQLSARRIEWGNQRHRDWLKKHMTWAINSGKAVEVAACAKAKADA